MKRALLNLLKKHSPDELEEWWTIFPELQDTLREFIHAYEYNYVNKKWKKKDI